MDKREQQFIACLLVVGPPPHHDPIKMHTQISICLEEAQAWRKECRAWYNKQGLNTHCFAVDDPGFQEWMSEFLRWQTEQTNAAKETT